MEKTDIFFYSFNQFGYSLLHIGGNGDLVKIFRLQTKYLKDKAFIYLKETRLFSAVSSYVSNVSRRRKNK